MLGLWSFGPALVPLLGEENFLACYLSSGVLSSFGGMLIRLATTATAPSLGASGSVLYLASITALIYPATQFTIIFFPFVSFPAPQVLMGIVALDITGLLMRWRRFDHGAHLAAVATGVTFVGWGADLITKYQRWVILQWRKVRKQIRG
eukprot:CAMPEP_0184306366 /NCGR_PEP_ID=MMETSP1049-20130417/15376_1 /TAXON_ID=77928 /ORGANISM="Proteomonas sulcata, Strain CCMP704" /LENGTH=148 /DNA_ID=CAMNT_0026618607 /DNA_START=185 /DNA_END=634 /DNA_ORIENTATION=+